MVTARNRESTTSLERSSDREIVISRTFDGPARIVFAAWTRADLVKRWWAPKSRASMVSCDADVRVGGRYRYVLRLPEGLEIAFSGTYTEVTPPTRLVYTSVFEPMRAAGESIVTATFSERDGKTELVVREVYPSKEILDGTLATGMESGMRETMDQLAALLADEVRAT